MAKPSMSKENKKHKLERIKDAWAYGCNDTEACQVAQISTRTLYEWMQADPSLKELREVLRSKPAAQARANVYAKIKKGDVETSKWYLERKVKEEFSTKAEFETKSVGVISIADKEEQLKEFMDKF